MACCIVAALILSHLFSLNDKVRAQLSRFKAWVTARPLRLSHASAVQLNDDLSPRRFRWGYGMMLVVGIEILAVMGLLWHELGDGQGTHHYASHIGLPSANEFIFSEDDLCLAAD